MEKALYYSYILSRHSTDENIKHAGNYLEMAVKYVYRGADTIDDSATKTNLEKLEALINKATNS